ncbi:tetratricopeptide repeat protein [Vibrio sp.]|uniref:tetratricopeptide repeat protein n=1 Tax=Vibrio sp. TaxID=678 RepID=UPI003AA82D83
MTRNPIKWLLLVALSPLLLGCATAEKVKKQTEDNTEALAEAAFNYGQYGKAEQQYLKLLELSPDHLNYQMMLARSQYRQDKKETAMAKLRYVCANPEPIAAQACMFLGRYLLSNGRVTEATEAYKLGLPKTDDPQVEAQLHNGLGIALLDSDAQQARMALQQAIMLSPDNTHFRSNLAISYLHDNQVEKARTTFSPLLAYQQLPQQVELNFALLLLAEGNEDQARALLARHLPASEVERDLAILNARLTAMRNVQ